MVGECLECFTFERTQRAIHRIVEVFPRRCWVLRDGQEVRVLTSDYFDNYIYRADHFCPWINRWIPRGALLTVYRAAFFYGTSRWIAWTIWAHVIHHYPYDLSWGGPHWVDAAHP